MRLAFCLYKYSPFGGLERDFMDIALACRERGHHITVFAREWSGDIPEGFHVVLFPTRGFTNHNRCYQFANAVQHILKERPFDLVVGFNKMPGLDVYYAADPCYRDQALRKYRYKFGPFLGMIPRFRYRVWLEQGVFSPSAKTRILLLSPTEQEVFIRNYLTPQERFYELPAGISQDRVLPHDPASMRQGFRKEFQVLEDEILLLMVGTCLRGKGLDRSLRALGSLPPHLRNRTKLFAVGEEPGNPFHRLAGMFKINGNFKMFPPRPDILRFMVGADLFLHPAYSDNTGTVILESIVSGLPVLATDSCGYSHHIIKADAGLVIRSPFKQAVLNQALFQSLDAPIRQAWSQNGLTYGKTQDLFQRSYSAMEFLETMANGKSCAHPQA